MKKLIISVVLLNLLAACASNKPAQPAATTPEPAATAPQQPVAVVPAPAAQATTAPVAVDPLNDPASALAKRSIYYPFDVSVVQAADKATVLEHAKYLAAHPDQKVRLEGNADERGSNEYNLALGQRRADGVKRMLILGGAKPEQLQSVSYGEEKPKAAGHDEASWSQNRRTDLSYAK